jgi:wyosine [tRNA(Phe)-imidazoG37] synthetase (radical SAM superfamily)
MLKSEGNQSCSVDEAYRKHERRWKSHRYTYAVVSRRSRGISIGLNLSPGKECNFRCIYCQVNREKRPDYGEVDTHRLQMELDAILQDERSGCLYEAAPFNLLPPPGRGVRDIAFSGDGEPTASPVFDAAVRIAVRARKRFELADTKIVLITNASRLDRPEVGAALEVMDKNNGEIWAKLDAGTEEYFQGINRPDVPLEKILYNILNAARIRPLVIQTLWLKRRGAVPAESEIEAYGNNLNRMLESGGQLKTLQLYTVARTPLEPYVSGLTNDELDRIARMVRERVPVTVEVFYGVNPRREGDA